jgi:glutathione S-transferase
MAAATEPREVKLYGAWGSAHAAMAQNALELKGVPYEYVEDDLDNKSETLLRLNPVHGGKVPVLVVDGRPLPESLVVIEYIDEAWPESRGYPPALLPRDPRARRGQVLGAVLPRGVAAVASGGSRGRGGGTSGAREGDQGADGRDGGRDSGGLPGRGRGRG